MIQREAQSEHENPYRTPAPAGGENESPVLPSGTTGFTAGDAFSVMCILLAVWLRMNSPGWSTLTMFFPNLLMLILHVGVMVFAFVKSRSARTLSLLPVLSLFFLLGIAFQIDYGDGRWVWFVWHATFTDLSAIDHDLVPSWWPFYHPLLSFHEWTQLLLFAPVVVGGGEDLSSK